MTQREHILADLRDALPGLKRRWPIRSLALFGSIVRGDAGPDSDLDILVEFERPVGLRTFLELELELATLARRGVDLVSRAALKPFIGETIIREAVLL